MTTSLHSLVLRDATASENEPYRGRHNHVESTVEGGQWAAFAPSLLTARTTGRAPTIACQVGRGCAVRAAFGWLMYLANCMQRFVILFSIEHRFIVE